MNNVLAILLAGGVGERLHPLTRDTAKPAVSFGGAYRIVDFTLSNCLNSHIRRIFILTQYKSLELNRHLRNGWSILSPEVGEFIEMIPPMKRLRDDWDLGTADAVFSKQRHRGRRALRLHPDPVRRSHLQNELRRDARLPPAESRRRDYRHNSGLASAKLRASACARSTRITALPDSEEKPHWRIPARSRFNPEKVSASMGVYVFNTDVLLRALHEDAQDSSSSHDFGKDVIPKLLRQARVIAYNFVDLNRKEALYWRDVGTIDAYYEANMDLVAVSPEFNLYDENWPVRTWVTQYPPAKFVFAQDGRRMGVALDSIVCAGCIVSGGRVVRSVLSPGVRVNSYCEVENSILMPRVEIGRNSRIRHAIICTGVKVAESSTIGFDADADRAAGYTITESGVVVDAIDIGN